MLRIPQRILWAGLLPWVVAGASHGLELKHVTGDVFGQGPGSAQVSFVGDQLVTIASTYDPAQTVDISFTLDWEDAGSSNTSLVDLNMNFTGTGAGGDGYRFVLGTGVGAEFEQSNDFDFLTIQQEAGVFVLSQESMNEISWSGAEASPAGGPSEYDFTVQLPSGLENFTLRQLGADTLGWTVMTAPEPTTLILLGSGLLGLAVSRRRRSGG